jgi:hypothetical protein
MGRLTEAVQCVNISATANILRRCNVNRLHKFAVLFIVVLLVIGLTLPACTRQQPTPPVPEQQGDIGLSFEATEYMNTEYGFSVKYPKEWLQQPSEEPTTVFYAASEKRVPALAISVMDGATFAQALTAALSLAGSDINIVTEGVSTLEDGTPATEAMVKWKVQNFGAETFALGVQKDGKWLMVYITTVPLLAKYNEALFSEVAHTLQLK